MIVSVCFGCANGVDITSIGGIVLALNGVIV